MKSYRASFVKKSGEVREMHFAKIGDLPKNFLDTVVKGTSSARDLKEGLELVWDLEVGSFRMFNWKSVEGAVKEEDVEVNFGVKL